MPPHKGQIFQKNHCLDCMALIPKEDPQIRDRFKCEFGIQIQWTKLDNNTEFYAPTVPCPKPRNPADLKTAKKKFRNYAFKRD